MAGYGMRPSLFSSGGYSSGGFTEYPIIDGETDNMFTGHFMLQEASGYVTVLAATPTGATAILSTIGVAMGFRYNDSNGEPVWSQKYVGHADNTEAFAFIADDPTQQFLIQQDSDGGTLVQADIGLNAPVVQGTGDSQTGLSGMVLDSSGAAVTATLALRVVSIPKDGSNENATGTTVNNLLVQINPAVHQRLRGLGL
jgi:RNase P/RNase MRP subunit p29